jgi:hypothetical protein
MQDGKQAALGLLLLILSVTVVHYNTLIPNGIAWATTVAHLLNLVQETLFSN